MTKLLTSLSLMLTVLIGSSVVNYANGEASLSCIIKLRSFSAQIKNISYDFNINNHIMIVTENLSMFSQRQFPPEWRNKFSSIIELQPSSKNTLDIRKGRNLFLGKLG